MFYMNIAIVHDYLHQYGGAEKVVETWLETYPKAVVYTTIFVPEKFTTSKSITLAYKEGRIKTTWLQWLLPKSLKLFKHFFWLYPVVMSFVEVTGYDTVLISSTYCGKNARVHGNKKTFHYCHSPTRFLHGLVTEVDHQSLSKAYRAVIPFFSWWLRILDLRAVDFLKQQNTVWIANSYFIQGLIKEVYGVESFIIYPPIEIEKFLSIRRSPYFGEEKYLLYHGRISFHKRIDLAIQACLETRVKLKISGTSALPRETEILKQQVEQYEKENPDSKGLIEFFGRTEMTELTELIKHASGFLFPGKEDFGIAPIEMLASGLPVIAYQAGGSLEYIQDGINGVFFENQEVQSVIQALGKFWKTKFNVPQVRESSRLFSKSRHQVEIESLINH
jgi:glycosyltransferase involved in cell wall biosynthesis